MSESNKKKDFDAKRISLCIEMEQDRKNRPAFMQNMHWLLFKCFIYLLFGVAFFAVNAKQKDWFPLLITFLAQITVLTIVQSVYWCYVFKKTNELVDFTDFVFLFMAKTTWGLVQTIFLVGACSVFLQLTLQGTPWIRSAVASVFFTTWVAYHAILSRIADLFDSHYQPRVKNKYSLVHEISRI